MPPAVATPLPPLPHRWSGKQWPTTAASPTTSAAIPSVDRVADARGGDALERVADQHHRTGLESGDPIDVGSARIARTLVEHVVTHRAGRRARPVGKVPRAYAPTTARTTAITAVILGSRVRGSRATA